MPRSSAILMIAGACLLGGCAGTPVVQTSTVAAAVDEPFAIDGRLSARRGSEGVSVSFTWTHDPPRDELQFTTPLGQQIAQFSSDQSVPHAEVRTADGGRAEAGDWTQLTERVMGFPLPVTGLAWWVRGSPRGGSPHSLEVDAGGRAGVLWQDGCEIVYTYSPSVSAKPSGLRLTCNDVELRMVVDHWRTS